MDAVRFSLDGEQLVGTRGDTVAAALLANGRLRVGDSLHLARPRGIVAAGADEPNALIAVRRADGAASESMLLAATVELVEGMQVTLLSGRGELDPRGDDARYDHRHVHADVAVVGAGPAGLAAALAAGRSTQHGVGGARVMLLDDQPAPGGALLDDPRATVDDLPAAEWIRSATAELDAMPHVRRLARTSVTGSYDDNYLVAVERRTDHLDDPPRARSRQRVWHIRAGQVVLATGADERPLVFSNNDRPGIMLAGAVRTYLNRYGLDLDRAGFGRLPVIATTNDSAYALAHDLLDRSRAVALVVDARADPGPAAAALAARGVPVRAGAVVVDTGAGDDGHLAAVSVAGLAADGALARGSVDTVAADLLAVSGGWSPASRLHSQRAGTLGWDETLGGFVPGRPVAHQHTAGAVTGALDLRSALIQGSAAGARAATAAGFTAASLSPPAAPPEQIAPPRSVWLIPSPDGRFDRHFVDLQRDQTVADVMRARDAGLHAVEHVKRYTSIATAHDQGRTSSLALAGVLAVLDGLSSPAGTGLTTFRPPTVPVAFAALAGRRRGELFDPVRTTPIHAWHAGAGAVFEDVGQWRRPRYYPRPGEDLSAAVLRECATVRERVGIMDASTLGKIELRGRDVGVFLDRIYTNRFSNLAAGRARYGVMCTADGMIFDDGVTIRLDEQRWLMTTTTGGAAAVLDWLEEWLQTEWPELDVVCTSVTEQFATIAIAGPRSRAVVAALAPALDVSAGSFGFLDSREATLASGIPARISRISFSGELAYEVMVDGWYGLRVWNDVLDAGGEGITPYGTEAMHVLRAEKGYIICGQDTDGTVTPEDAGLSWMVSRTKDFIGRRSFSRPENRRPDRKHLVSLLPADPDLVVPEGAALVEVGAASGEPPVPLQGWVTSSYRSAALGDSVRGRSFALALVAGGRERLGETLHASFGGRVAEVVIGPTVVFDPEGRRRDG